MRTQPTTLLLAALALTAGCAEAPDIEHTTRGLTGFLTPDTQVSTTVELAQDRPAAAVDGQGVTLVVFRDTSAGDGGDIRGRFLSIAGVPLGSDFVINTVTAAAQDRPDLAVNDDGVFLVVWQDASLTAPDSSGSAVRARRVGVGQDGAPSFLDAADFVVPSRRSSAQTFPAVDAAPDGGFIVVWQDSVHTVDLTGTGIRARRLGTDGVPLGVDRQVNSTTAGNQTRPDVATGADGSYLVVFTDASGTDDPSSTGIRARHIGADDVPRGPDVLVNSTTGGAQRDPAVAPGEGGEFLVVWADGSGVDDAAPQGIRASRLSGATPVGSELLVNSTRARSQTLPAVAFDGGDGSFVLAWADASRAAPDTSMSAIRARRLLPDDTFSELDAVVNTVVEGGQSQPALPMRAATSLVYAWTGPDGSSLGIMARAMLLACPARTGNDFHADPLADRSMPGLPAPTGARSPAVCAYPRLTDALAPASAVAATGASARVIASRDSAPTQLAVFAAEAFPLEVPAGVRVTTTDDPAVGGSGFVFNRFSIVVDSAGGGGPASVRLLGAAERTGAGGALAGFLVTGSCADCPPVAVRVEGFGAESTPRLQTVWADGAAAAGWQTGIEVRGNGLLRGVMAQGFASIGTDERIGIHVVDDAGSQAGDRVRIDAGQATQNNIGVAISGGQVWLTGNAGDGRSYSNTVLADQTGGVGLRIRDWRVDGQGNLVVTPTTVDAGQFITYFNQGNGIVVDLSDPASVAAFFNVTSRDNRGHGLQVDGAPHANAALDQIAAPVTEYGVAAKASIFEGNMGDGISIGSTKQTRQIVAWIGDAGLGNSIHMNRGAGLRVRQSAAPGSCPTGGTTACTGVTIAGNEIVDNFGPGVDFGTAILVPYHLWDRPGLRRGFLANTVGHNGYAGAQGCTAAQSAPQVLVSGRTGLPAGVCAAQTTQSACEARSGAADNNHCIWAAKQGCRVAWDLRGSDTSCDGTLPNRMWDYNTSDTAPSSVGLYATGSSLVLADGNIWKSSATAGDHVGAALLSFVDADQICGWIAGCHN